MPTIRLVIADDQLLFRKCLQALIRPAPEIEVVGEATNGLEAVQRVRELQPDVILLDLLMPHLDGLSAIRHILQEAPKTKILVITSFEDDENLFSALRAGAQGYMLKDAAPGELLTAIHSIYQGQSYLHASIALKVLNQLCHPAGPAGPDDPAGSPGQLTKRQQEVLDLVTQGCTNLEIADKLFIAETTASKHVSHILDKLHVSSRVQAALHASHQT